MLEIDPAAPGFRRVLIQSFPGNWKEVGGAIACPGRRVSVHLNLLSDGNPEAEIELSPDTPGALVWKAEHHPQQPGASRLQLQC